MSNAKNKVLAPDLDESRTECLFEENDTFVKICEKYRIPFSLFKFLNPHLDSINVGSKYFLTPSILNRVKPEDDPPINTIANRFQNLQISKCFCDSEIHPHVFLWSDTVSAICRQYGITWNIFRKNNPHIEDINRVFVGQPYIIFSSPEEAANGNKEFQIEYPFFDSQGNNINEKYLEKLKNENIKKWKTMKKKTKFSASSAFAYELSEALFDEEDKKKCCHDRDGNKVKWLEKAVKIHFESVSKDEEKRRWKNARENIDAQKRKKFASKRKRGNSPEPEVINEIQAFVNGADAIPNVPNPQVFPNSNPQVEESTTTPDKNGDSFVLINYVENSNNLNNTKIISETTNIEQHPSETFAFPDAISSGSRNEDSNQLLDFLNSPGEDFNLFNFVESENNELDHVGKEHTFVVIDESAISSTETPK